MRDDLRPMRAVIWWTIACAIGWLFVFALLARAATPDLLLIQHTYDGQTEQAGTLVAWRYTGGHMLVEWVDTTTDGVFRNGFDP